MKIFWLGKTPDFIHFLLIYPTKATKTLPRTVRVPKACIPLTPCSNLVNCMTGNHNSGTKGVALIRWVGMEPD